MNKAFLLMMARARRIASDHKALRLEVLRAVSALTRLSGLPPYNTSDNLQMGDLIFALKLKRTYAPGVLAQARAILDSSQGLDPQDDCDPITPSFDYGQVRKQCIKRNQLQAFNFKGTTTGRFSCKQPNPSNKPSNKDKL